MKASTAKPAKARATKPNDLWKLVQTAGGAVVEIPRWPEWQQLDGDIVRTLAAVKVRSGASLSSASVASVGASPGAALPHSAPGAVAAASHLLAVPGPNSRAPTAAPPIPIMVRPERLRSSDPSHGLAEIAFCASNNSSDNIDYVRWVVSELSAVSDTVTQPWAAIYPQRPDGVPMHVPSGLYHVRLYWMGAWRRVPVDDTRPLGELAGKGGTGNVNIVQVVRDLLRLAQRPPDGELWQGILTKAVLKVAHMCLLTGWGPETVAVPPRHMVCATTDLWERLLHATDPAQPRLVITASFFKPAAVLDDPAAVASNAALRSKYKDAGLSLDMPHTFRVLRLREFLDADGAVQLRALLVRSPFVSFRGRLNIGNERVWTRAMERDFGLKRQDELKALRASMQLHCKGEDHAPFGTWFSLEEFCEFFDQIVLYHAGLDVANVCVAHIDDPSLERKLGPPSSPIHGGGGGAGGAKAGGDTAALLAKKKSGAMLSVGSGATQVAAAAKGSAGRPVATATASRRKASRTAAAQTITNTTALALYCETSTAATLILTFSAFGTSKAFLDASSYTPGVLSIEECHPFSRETTLVCECSTPFCEVIRLAVVPGRHLYALRALKSSRMSIRAQSSILCEFGDPEILCLRHFSRESLIVQPTADALVAALEHVVLNLGSWKIMPGHVVVLRRLLARDPSKAEAWLDAINASVQTRLLACGGAGSHSNVLVSDDANPGEAAGPPGGLDWTAVAAGWQKLTRALHALLATELLAVPAGDQARGSRLGAPSASGSHRASTSSVSTVAVTISAPENAPLRAPPPTRDEAALRIQRAYRSHRWRVSFIATICSMNKSAKVLQRNVRGFLGRRRVKRLLARELEMERWLRIIASNSYHHPPPVDPRTVTYSPGAKLAAITLQKYTRRHLAVKLARAKKATRLAGELADLKAGWTFLTAHHREEMSAHALRLALDAKKSWRSEFVGIDDMEKTSQILTSTGNFDFVAPLRTSLAFRETFFVSSATTLFARATTGSGGGGDLMLVVTDNDTNRVMPMAFGQPLAAMYPGNQRGYTVTGFLPLLPPAHAGDYTLQLTCGPHARHVAMASTPPSDLHETHFRGWHVANPMTAVLSAESEPQTWSVQLSSPRTTACLRLIVTDAVTREVLARVDCYQKVTLAALTVSLRNASAAREVLLEGELVHVDRAEAAVCADSRGGHVHTPTAHVRLVHKAPALLVGQATGSPLPGSMAPGPCMALPRGASGIGFNGGPLQQQQQSQPPLAASSNSARRGNQRGAAAGLQPPLALASEQGTLDPGGVSWDLVVINTTAGARFCTFSVAPSRQSEIECEKRAWELLQPGRRAVAHALRAAFLQSQHATTVPPLPMPAVGVCNIAEICLPQPLVPSDALQLLRDEIRAAIVACH